MADSLILEAPSECARSRLTLQSIRSNAAKWRCTAQIRWLSTRHWVTALLAVTAIGAARIWTGIHTADRNVEKAVKAALCYYTFSFPPPAWSIDWHINILTIQEANVTSGVQSGDLFVENVFRVGAESGILLIQFMSNKATCKVWDPHWIFETQSEKCALARSRHEILMFCIFRSKLVDWMWVCSGVFLFFKTITSSHLKYKHRLSP